MPLACFVGQRPLAHKWPRAACWAAAGKALLGRKECEAVERTRSSCGANGRSRRFFEVGALALMVTGPAPR